MDIKQLKYLIALDQTRHFGQAAALCHITQPTLSMRIRNLEEELNLVLIQRSTSSHVLSEALRQRREQKLPAIHRDKQQQFKRHGYHCRRQHNHTHTHQSRRNHNINQHERNI